MGPYAVDYLRKGLFSQLIESKRRTMSQDESVSPVECGSGVLARSQQLAAHYADAARAPSTRALYARIWKRWEAWCRLARTPALPADPAAVAGWLAQLAHEGRSVSAVSTALAAVQFQHREAGKAIDRRHPAIGAVLGGIQRRSARPVRGAAPLSLEALRSVVAAITGDDLAALRDRALILVGFWGALRRSEVAGLDCAGRSPVSVGAEGLALQLTGTKTSAVTQTVVIPRRDDGLCAVAAVEAYLGAAAIAAGPLFRPLSKTGCLLPRRLNAASVAHILKVRLGEDAGRGLSAHSLRAGFITAAAQAGAPEHLIQAHSRHRSVDVLRGYVRPAQGSIKAAAGYIG